MPDLSRRTFLRFAAASVAGAACSPRALPQKLIPFLVPPDEIVPGRPLFYRTVCRACPAGCGVTARTREGRAVKLEGNPEDPIGRGALCARGQAELQHLYAPDRLAGPRRRGADGQLAPVGWDEAEDALAAALSAAAAKGPGRIRMLTRAEPGSAGAVQKALLRALGGRDEDRLVFEPLDPMPLRAAEEALFGAPQLPVHDLSAARTVVAFGADFLETWLSPVELTRQLAEGRGRAGPERTRLWWVGPRLSATGMSADRWLRARSGGELALALALLRWLFEPGHLAALPPELAPLAGRVAALDAAALLRRAGLAREDLEALGRELAARRPSALLGPGAASQGGDATQLAAVLLLCNLALGNLGRTVLHGLDPLEDPPAPFAEVNGLLGECAAGAVDVLLLHHADPVGALPAALRAGDALARVPLVVTFASRPDASGARAHLHLPDHHPLEAFGEITPRRGVVALGQPAMTPVGDTRAAAQVLLELGGRLPQPAAHFPFGDLWELLQARAELFLRPVAAGATDLGPVLHAAQERGGVYSEASPAPVTLDAAAAARFLTAPAEPPAAAAAGAGALDLVLFPTALRGDGQGPRPPWLDEVSDTVTTLSWTAWAELSPATAARLGLAAGDLVAVSTGAGRAELPVYLYPGLRDDAVAVPLGGAEALALLPAGVDAASGALAFAGQRAAVARAGRRVALPVLEGSPYQEGRAIVKNVSAAAPAVKRPDLSATMYEEPKHPVHRWALAVDLDKCTGCDACVVACYAENNVPVMGREAAVMGRQMGWIRIERYLGEVRGGRLRIDLMPMMCQQCTNAPCEPVCPVYATYHTPEGLNAQVYNRCVGTRYCSNNCPYKVRTFNWRDAQFARPLDWQLNPDVTVRSKGVMEKCTFCVQRIRYAEGVAKDEGRPVRDGEITPACAQTCPAQAIVFGDANDPTSRVSRLAAAPRGFAALEEVNTLPAVTYLARVREEDL
ncbi:4Fe-4S dicluster domain-containing protein [Anaeromyxobacter diazotrophicus]|uniref:Fe-S-cluster-containing hydrogenase n=1 Tax=Anaeromyxobacter diazotrophicus TaxID=2590199 RepID=A0A7I9VRG0_9BACT|nr:4Fe-4S dicluster domain-containing protein [Anaeromyxobacter diazotrophicus]GEJ58941.1 Fe-S-cluster-containing hydrogenase [Anaeromyxobacter diazotrophicus]